MIFGGVGWCDIHVMDARQSVNWPRYIEDDDYFTEGREEPQTIHP